MSQVPFTATELEDVKSAFDPAKVDRGIRFWSL